MSAPIIYHAGAEQPAHQPHDPVRAVFRTRKAWDESPIETPSALQSLFEEYGTAEASTKNIADPPRPDGDDLAALATYEANLPAVRKQMRDLAERNLWDTARRIRTDIREMGFELEEYLVDGANAVLDRLDEIDLPKPLPRGDLADYRASEVARYLNQLPYSVLDQIEGVKRDYGPYQNLWMAMASELLWPMNKTGRRCNHFILRQTPGTPDVPLGDVRYRHVPQLGYLGLRLSFGRDMVRWLTMEDAFKLWRHVDRDLCEPYIGKF